jgi:hypothetical protein
MSKNNCFGVKLGFCCRNVNVCSKISLAVYLRTKILVYKSIILLTLSHGSES